MEENVVPDHDKVNLMEPNMDSVIKLWLTVLVPAPVRTCLKDLNELGLDLLATV